MHLLGGGVTRAALPVWRPLTIAATSAPSVLVLPSSSLSNLASKIPPCGASKLVTVLWKVCSSETSALMAWWLPDPTSCSACCPSEFDWAMKLAQKLVWSALSWYRGVGLANRER